MLSTPRLIVIRSVVDYDLVRVMKIIFNQTFHDSNYADNGAAVEGRMEAAIRDVQGDPDFEMTTCVAATPEDILRVHDLDYFQTIQKDTKLFDMAMLAAGGAIYAAKIAYDGEPAFAAIRPPGHHASRASSWGSCYFSNMAVALCALKDQGKIERAFVIDFDAHTGDGTLDIFSKKPGLKAYNPYAPDPKNYIEDVRERLEQAGGVDIIAVCAGFDSYKKDLGKKLGTLDFYQIGSLVKRYANRYCAGRRFAVLEGGYYLPDLGKNVHAFCQGMDD